MQTKVCTKCLEEKDISLFGTRKNRYGNNYSYATCKACQSKYKKQHRIDNLENYKEVSKKYYEEHKEDVSLYKKRWKVTNKDSVLQGRKEYYIKNADKIREKAKEYCRTQEGKDVQKRSSRKYLLTEEGKYKHACRDKVTKAIASGELLKPAICSSCKKEGSIEAHHPDYSKPLEVVWLCKRCHAIEHKKNKSLK